MDEDDDEVRYDLVMPFVVCASQGGPYEDDSFVAGYHLGEISAMLAQEIAEYQTTIRTASVPQLDLIAMRWGYSFTTVGPMAEVDPDEWTQVILTREPAS